METSCASCGKFMAKAELALIPVDDDCLCSMKSLEGVVQLDSCRIVNGGCVTGVRAYGHVVVNRVAKGLWLPKRYAVSRD